MTWGFHEVCSTALGLSNEHWKRLMLNMFVPLRREYIIPFADILTSSCYVCNKFTTATARWRPFIDASPRHIRAKIKHCITSAISLIEDNLHELTVLHTSCQRISLKGLSCRDGPAVLTAVHTGCNSALLLGPGRNPPPPVTRP